MHRQEITENDACDFLCDNKAFKGTVLQENFPNIYNELFQKMLSSHLVLHVYRDISTDCKNSQTLIFNSLARHENQVLPTRDSYRDCSVAGRTNTGVIPVSREQPYLDASVVGRTDTGVIPVYSEKHNVDVSVASTTDT